MLWTFCLILAALECAAAVGGAVLLWLRRRWSSKGRLYLLAVGAFVIMFTLLFPHFWESSRPVLDRIMLNLHGAAQAFTFDISIKEILDGIAERQPACLYTGAVSVMAMVCPLFTIGLILSFFKNFWSRMRFAFHFRKCAYVFSELNEMTLAFAKSVVDAKKGLVVFANAYAKEETEPELLEDARSIHAICFTKSVEHLPIHRIKRKSARPIRILLLEPVESQSNALAEALELAKLYQARPNMRVYLYSASAAAGRVIDSAQSVSQSMGDDVVEKVFQDPAQIWDEAFWEKTSAAAGSGFYLQRIDPEKTLALQTLSNEDLVRFLKDAADENKVISLMILGLGGIGSQLLKTAAWLYQVDGYTVEINAFDQRGETLRRTLEEECPGLLNKELGRRCGDAHYDVDIFCETDCFTSDFEALLLNGRCAEKLQRTQVVFVTLGDDDRNIEAATRLRILFRQIRSATDKKVFALQPRIYSAVFDDTRLANLNLGASNADAQGPALVPSMLRNHSGDSYDVVFFGSLSSQYSVQALDALLSRQNKALSRHLSWMLVQHFVRKAYEAEPVAENAFRRRIAELCRLRDEEPPESIWDPLELVVRELPAEKPPAPKTKTAGNVPPVPEKKKDPLVLTLDEARQLAAALDAHLAAGPVLQTDDDWVFGTKDAAGKVDEQAVVVKKKRDKTTRADPTPVRFHAYAKADRARRFEGLKKNFQRYFAYEYYRDSSVATSLHKERIAPIFGMPHEAPKERAARMIALDDASFRRRITEHRRWNAYMRSLGFRFGDPRDDLGLLHHDLVPFAALSPMDQLKD